MVAGAGLSEQARALLGRRARAQEDGAAASGFGHRAGSESAPLSSWQESIWFLDQMEPGRGLNNTPAWLRLKGDLDVAALEKSLEEVFRRHVILRSHVGIEDGDAVQRPMQDFGFALPLIDLSVLAPQEREARYAAIAAAEARAPFDLAAGPFARATLIRLAADEHVLLFTAHHIAFDGWSVAVFFRELGALYGAFATGQSSSLADLRFQYADFAVWQRERLLSSSIDDDVAYWLTQMAGAPSLLALPADRPRPAARSHAAGRTSTVIPLELAARLGVLGREEGATLFMTMLAAFQLLLSRLSGEHDVVVGIPIAGRTKVETEMMLGCFINMLPLRTRILDDASFRDLLSGVRRTSLGALAHQELPFDALVERLEPERSLGHTPVTQVLFNFRNAPASEAQFHGLEVALEPPRAATIISDFHIEIEPGPGGLNCIALYSAELFDAATVERWLGHFQTLLESIVASPDECVARLPLLSSSERRHILVDWNVTATPVDYETCVHELFESQVQRTPDAIAVVGGSETLTYDALNRRANRLARDLAARGVGPDVVVGVCMERCPDLIVALLAVLKAGGAYLPLDPDYPVGRLAFMQSDSCASVLIAQRGVVDQLAMDSPQTIYIDAAYWDEAALDGGTGAESHVAPYNLAYVIYTSGSTGRPKGVMIEHRSVCNFLLRSRDRYDFTASDVVLQRTPLSFDPSVREVFATLAVGARIVLTRPHGHGDPEHLAAMAEEHGVTVLSVVPSLLRVLLDVPEVSRRCRTVRIMPCGGEALSSALQERQAATLTAALHNLYGPTETTVNATGWKCERGTTRRCIPIGHPLGNVRIYILDSEMEPASIGVVGELYVGGVGVGRGYLNRPELTAERFVPDPFSGVPGARMYRTGDRARFDPDGEVEFLGRSDYQLKLRGVRIELGEIETVLATTAGVRESVVVAREDQPGEVRLVAYIVQAEGGDVSSDALRRHLRETLLPQMVPSAFVMLDALPLTPNGKVDRRSLPVPDYMIPAAFVPLGAIPVTENGKVDRLALPIPAGGASAESSVRRGPRDPVQDELVHLWEEMLNVSSVGVTDDFFELGGHSLLAVAMMQRVALLFGTKPSLSVLFQEPTIQHLASALIATSDLVEPRAVCVQAGAAARTPFFLLHGDFQGGGLYCRRLVQHFDPEQPVYVLAPHQPGGPGTIEEMAADVLPHIRQVQSRGPYLLGGYCNGGFVAIEIARQLRAIGERVDFLAVIDLSARNVELARLFDLVCRTTKLLGFDRRRQIDTFLKMHEPALRLLRELPRVDQSSGLGRRLIFAGALTSLLGRRAARRGWRAGLRVAGLRPPECIEESPSEDMTPDDRLRNERGAYISRAMQSYIPRPFSGTITVIGASDGRLGGARDQLRHWEAIGTRVESFTIPGDHGTIVTRHVDALGALFRAQIPRTG